MLSSFLIQVVGFQLLFSGAIKSLDSGHFVKLLQSYRLFPEVLLPVLSVGIIGTEWLLGVTMLRSNCVDLVVPLAMIFLSCVTALSLAMYRLRKIEECGCYGRYLPMSPLQSAAINAVSIGCLFSVRPGLVSVCTSQELVPGFAAATIGVFLAGRSTQVPLFERLKRKKE
jgi:hypothetical protein